MAGLRNELLNTTGLATVMAARLRVLRWLVKTAGAAERARHEAIRARRRLSQLQ